MTLFSGRVSSWLSCRVTDYDQANSRARASQPARDLAAGMVIAALTDVPTFSPSTWKTNGLLS
jgi:hypothetical protein